MTLMKSTRPAVQGETLIGAFFNILHCKYFHPLYILTTLLILNVVLTRIHKVASTHNWERSKTTWWRSRWWEDEWAPDRLTLRPVVWTPGLYHLCTILPGRYTLAQNLPAAALGNTRAEDRSACPHHAITHSSQGCQIHPHRTVALKEVSFPNLAPYHLNSPALLTHWAWLLIMINLQSKYRISRSNYMGFSGILKKHKLMTCLTFFPFYFEMTEAI